MHRVGMLPHYTTYRHFCCYCPLDETDITCSNDLCHDAKWVEEELGHFEVEYPPMKDNLLIPVGGYAVIRIYTDNPGYWLAHCHQDTHLYMGMVKLYYRMNFLKVEKQPQ